LPDQDHDVAGVLNEIFCLEIDWSFTGQREFNLRELQAFDDLCQELARRLSSSKLETAMWFLSQARHAVRADISDDALFEPLSLTADQKRRLRELMTYPAFDEAFEIARTASRGGAVLETLFTKCDQDRLFDTLLRVERLVLREAGLNQQSVAIITERIARHKLRIIENIVDSRSVLINRLGPAIGAMASMARISVRLSNRSAPNRPITLRSVRNLVRAKEKVIGLATLWGDALPLLLARDWGIAGVFSTAAGATVAALLPRGDE
jgi:hypothetical protein